MKIMQILTVLLLSFLVLGCATTSINEHSSASNVDDEWTEGFGPGESANLDPKWYWDEAWKDENSFGPDLLDEVIAAHSKMKRCCHYLCDGFGVMACPQCQRATFETLLDIELILSKAKELT